MRRILGVALILVFGAVALLSLLTGTLIYGWRPPSSQCSLSADYPTEGGPFYETTRVQGYPTYLPLGMVCTYDVDGDDYGPQSVVHQNWPATITLAGSLGLVVTGFVVALRRPRASHPRAPGL